MSTSTLELPTGQQQDTASWAAIAFIASYSSRATRRTYTTHLRLWMTWCAVHQLDPLADIRRPHVELYARELEACGLAAATVALKLVVLTGFYRYCVEEELVDHSPAVHVRRPNLTAFPRVASTPDDPQVGFVGEPEPGCDGCATALLRAAAVAKTSSHGDDTAVFWGAAACGGTPGFCAMSRDIVLTRLGTSRRVGPGH